MSRTYRQEPPNEYCRGVAHRDKSPGRRHAPAWYRRQLNRRYRRRADAAARHAAAPPPFKRNADWNWF